MPFQPSSRPPSRRTIPSLHRWFFERSSQLVLVLTGVLLVSLGCSKEEFKEAINTATEKTQEIAKAGVESIESQLPEKGQATLKLDTDVTIKSASVQLISVGDGRANVFQIATYDTTQSSRTFPALLLHGGTSAAGVTGLSGEKINCDMYYQESYSSPIAMTKPGSSIIVNVNRFDAERNVIEASLGMADLITSDGKVVRVSGGDIVALIAKEQL